MAPKRRRKTPSRYMEDTSVRDNAANTPANSDTNTVGNTGMEPKRRRRVPSRHVEQPPTEDANARDVGDTPSNMDSVVNTCMERLLPTLEDTFRSFMDNFHSGNQRTASSSVLIETTPESDGVPLEQSIPLLDEITSGNRIPSSIPSHAAQTNPCSAGPSASLRQTQDYLVRNSLAPSTISAYKSSFHMYKDFVTCYFGSRAEPFPPSLQHLSGFIAHCFLRGLAASSTRTHISSLSFTFQLGGYQDITQHFIIKKMLLGFHKAKPSSDARLPITPAILAQLVHAVQYTTSSHFLRLLLRAMFILAFCAFLRVGEITKTSQGTQHFLRFHNIVVQKGPNQRLTIEINIPHYKHSKSNVTTLRLLQNTNNPSICPCMSLVKYLQFRKHSQPSDPLFSFMDGQPISKQFFTQQLRSALAFCNLDLHRYQSHSFRIGAATTAAASGFSELQIQNMGRWRSSAFKQYIRIPTLNV